MECRTLLSTALAVVVPCLLLCQALEKTEGSADYAALPYLTHERLILVPATVEGLEGFLILDTGAPGLVLNRHYFDQRSGDYSRRELYGVNRYILAPFCQAVGTIRLTGMGKSNLRSAMAHLRGMTVGPLTLSSLRIAFIDLMHLNMQVPGPRLDGILGFDFIYQRKTALNFRKRALYLWEDAPDHPSIIVDNQ